MLNEPSVRRQRSRSRGSARHPALRIARIFAGILLLLLSPLMVFVPFVMSYVLIIAGLSLLAPESWYARWALIKLRLRLRALKRSIRRRRAGRDASAS
jgi:hypothetical protein